MADEIKSSKLVYCFDIDQTICASDPEDYTLAEPHLYRIEVINQLYFSGHKIIFSTARGSLTGIDHSALTINQLKAWNVKYHELHFGKPYADLYIDDKGINDFDFFDSEVE